MAENDADADGPPTSDAELPEADASEGGTAEPALDRTELKVMRARQSLEEEAEAARRRVLGSRSRSRPRPATLVGLSEDDDVDLSEHLRQLVDGVEEETGRLQEEVSRLRSAAGRAGATLQDDVQRAADEIAERSVEDLVTAVGQVATESLQTLTAAIASLQETAARLYAAATGLDSSVERLGGVAPVVDQLTQLATTRDPATIVDALANVLGDLTSELSALGEAVSGQVRTAIEEGLATELGRHEARIEHALARVVDELARTRRRLPVTKRPPTVELSDEALDRIGQAVADALLASVREQSS
jgi:hypothetical protein